MKKKVLLFALTLLFSEIAFSQAPQFMNYQGVARNSSGTVINSGNIGLKFEILQGSPTGSPVYTEENSSTPSAAGVFTTAIGSGTNTSGVFSSINWANGPYFIRVSIDPTGGTSFIAAGTSQLLSAPYALYAEKAGNVNLNSGNGISISSGTITNTAPNQTVNISGPNVLGAYPNYTLTGGTNYSAGTGISITGSVIANTAPDQTVTISGPGVSGVYPSFNITPPAPSTITSSGSSILVTGTDPNFTITPSPSLTVTGNQLSILDGNTVTLPTGTTYTNGPGIAFTSGTIITNMAPDQTVTIGSGINTNVTGTYPNFIIDATPSLSLASNVLSISGGNSVTLPSPPTPTAGTGISIVSGTISNTAPDQVVTIGSGINTNVTGTYPSFIIDATPSLSISGNTLSITGGTPVILPSPPILTSGAGISIVSGSIINTAPDQTVTLTGLGATTVSGTYPNFTVNTPALNAGTGIAISSGSIINTSPDQAVILNGLGSVTVTGAYPNFNINAPVPVSPVISGTGAAAVTTSGNNYTVNVPYPAYNNTTGAFTTGTNVITVAPTLAITGNTLSSGPTTNSVTIPSYTGGSGIILSGTTPSFSFGLAMTGTNTAWNALGNTGTSAGTNFLGTTDAQDLVFKTANNQRMRIYNSNGSIGIGNISTPTELLQVETGSTTAVSILAGNTSNLYFGNTGNHFLGALRYDNAANSLDFWTNNTANRLFINSNGLVAIGHNAPSYQMDIQSNSANLLRLTTASANTNVKIDAFPTGAAGELQISSIASGMSFVTNSAIRMKIDGSGNVGIGGVITPLARLDILGGSTYFRPNGGNPNALLVQDFIGTAMRLYTDATAGTPYDLILGTYPNGHLNQLFLKQSNGFVGVGNNNPVTRLHVSGQVTIQDGTEGAGKVLTSNTSGTASWQVPSSPSRVRDVVVDPGMIDLTFTTIPPTKIMLGGWQRPCINFPDASMTQIQCNIPIPSDWNTTSSFTIEVLYSSPGTTGNFYVSIGNSDVGLNQNAASATSSTAYSAGPSGTAEGLMILSHVMFTSATDKMIQIYIRRDGANGSDTSTQPMHFYGFKLKYMD